MQETTLLFYFGTIRIRSPKDYVNIGTKNIQIKISEIGARIISLKRAAGISERDVHQRRSLMRIGTLKRAEEISEKTFIEV